MRSKRKAAARDFLRISYKLKESTIWADKGFEVASEQFKLPMNTPPVFETKSTQPIKVNQNPESVKVTEKVCTYL